MQMRRRGLALQRVALVRRGGAIAALADARLSPGRSKTSTIRRPATLADGQVLLIADID
jgi:hypothetical protein